MGRGRSPTAVERRDEDRAKALYLDRDNPRTLEEIASTFGRSIGWILALKKRDGWPDRNKVAAVTDRDRKIHGELAEDVVYLRSTCGLLVAPFRGGYRINTEVVTHDELRDRASAERARRKRGTAAKALPTPAAPAAPEPPPPPTPAIPEPSSAIELCGCGRPKNHYGRCAARRGIAPLMPKPAAAPVAQTVSPFAGTSADGPLSDRVAKLEAEVRALRKIVRQDVNARRAWLNHHSKHLADLEGALGPSG